VKHHLTYRLYAGGWSVRAIEEVLTQLKSEVLKPGLEVNANKAKYVRVMRNLPDRRQDLDG
jgi:hypothetical protein